LGDSVVSISSKDFNDNTAYIISLFFLFAGFFVFVYQSYLFLRHSELFLFSLIDFMVIINHFTYFAREWVNSPTDWTGLHQIMSWTPLAPTLFFAGLYIAYMDD